MSELRCPYCGNKMIAHRIWELSGSGEEIELHQYGCVECGAEAPAALTKEHARAAAETWKPKWISVEDSKKPRHGQECLCICAMENDPKHEWDYQMVLKWYAYGSNGLVDRPHFQHEGCEGMTVTYWMPLPKAPEVSENE